MIYDSIDHFIDELPDYMPRLAEAAGFLEAARTMGFEELKAADFAPLDLRFGEYETQSAESIPFEAHRKFWDLQLLIEGEELFAYAPLEDVRETVPYNKEEDIAYYEGAGEEIKLRRGNAVLLAPWDAHRPGASCGKTPSHIKKIVIKLPWQPAAQIPNKG